MKKNSLIIILIFSAACFAIENSIGNPTVPPSSTRSGVVRSPSPIDLNGNLVVTGNVRGGKEFRGFVPYRSETEFSGPLGGDTFNTFLKQSAPMDISSRRYLPQPYYQPSRTVSSIARGGTSGLITYSSVRESGGTGDYVVPGYVKIQTASGLPAILMSYEYTSTRPLSYNNTFDLERLVSYGLMSHQERRNLDAALQKITDKSKQESPKTDMPTTQQEDKKALSPLEPIKPTERSERIEPLKNNEMVEEPAKDSKVKSIYEQMLENVAAEKSPAQQPAKEVNEPNAGQTEDISYVDTQTTSAVQGTYKTFVSRANTKFNYYMKSAEEFLKQGKYYRAADAYTLASIYKPDDPLAYAGKSHSLFASGEYMSSAYYLTRAINIFPEYVKVKIDLNAMIPDKDRLENRITDVTKWIEKTGSGELEFLLAYVYYQLDKPEQAKNAIDSSAQKMPNSQAVQALKQAIEK